MHVLNFAPNPYMLIPLIGIGIYGFLFYRIYKLQPRSNANIWFLIYLATSLAAGVMDLLGSISTTPSDATIWYLLFFVLNTLSFSSLLGFTLSFTQHTKFLQSPVVRVLLYLPSFIVSCLLLFTDLIMIHDSTKTTMIHMMWRLTEGKLRGPLYFGWIQLTVIGSIVLFILYARKVHDHSKKVQSMMYAIALIVQVVVDVVILNIFPILLNIFIVPDGIVSIFFLGSILAYGILKYNLFVINPASVASTIVDTMSDMLIVLNPEGNVEYINEAASQTLGLAASDVIGKQAKLFFKDQWDQIEKRVVEPLLHRTDNVRIKSSLTIKDGTVVPISLFASAVKENEHHVVGIVCVATNISQLIQLQDVTNQRDTLDKIIESLKDAVLAFDKDHLLSICNSASLSMISSSKDAIKGRSIVETVKLYDQDSPVDLNILIQQAAQSSDGITQRNALELQDSQGKRTSVNVIVTSIKDDVELNLAGFIVLQDLTKEKQLEEMKLDFVSIAAHELRTPITSLRGYISLVQDMLKDTIDPEISGMLQRVNISAQSLNTLVDNLLSVSQIEKGSLLTHMKSLDWLSVVKQAVGDIQLQAKDKNIQITVGELSERIPPVHADTVLIREVVANLLSNAVAFTPSGGTITITFELKDDLVITHIKDTGEGIPKEALPYLFTKFYHVSKPLEQGSKGTGLGLYIAKSIVDLHGGTIWVESEPGKGSQFSFSLKKII